MRRDERLALQDMYDAAEAIERFVGGRSKEEFLQDEAAATAVVYKMLVLGEATHHVSSSTRRRYPDVEWRRLVGMRNFLAHQYFGINWDILWNTVQRRIIPMRDQLAEILAEPPRRHGRRH